MTSLPLRVGLLFGGASGEHGVSIRSARTVLAGLSDSLNSRRYQVQCFYIDRQGRWWGEEVARAVLKAGLPAAEGDLPSHPDRGGFQGFPAGALAVEVWFPVLHGPNGEDGTIQGLFTLMQVPFVGSGVLGSAVGMDKQAMKAAFAAAGLPQVPHACVQAAELQADRGGVLQRLEEQLGYPCFVKPANLGSSVGISKACDRAQLEAGLELAAALDRRLVVERGVRARELECAVLGHDPLRASLVGEIHFDADWYDYEAKYSPGRSRTLIPAPLDGELTERVRSLAVAACRAVGADGLARVDFFYEEGNGSLWLNEINTLPGFTDLSMYPMLWQASGLSLPELIHELLQGARESCPIRSLYEDPHP